jgi:hypothetical protein
MRAWPSPIHEIRVPFRAPLSYVYRWLTDYSSQDPALEEGNYQRKVIEKDRRHAVLEDLTETKKGWEWYRTTVTLQPPDRWHAELRGNVPDWSLDYRLTPLGSDRTLLTIRWRMRPGAMDRDQRMPPKAATERMMRGLWRSFAKSLEREYSQAP